MIRDIRVAVRLVTLSWLLFAVSTQAQTFEEIFFVQGQTPVLHHQIVVDPSQAPAKVVLSLGLNVLQLGDITGEAILIKGTDQLARVPVGESSTEVTLGAGVYDLLAYADFGSASPVPILVGLSSDRPGLNYSQIFQPTVVEQVPQSSSVLVTQGLVIDAAQDVTVEILNFEQFETGDLFVENFPTLVMFSDSGMVLPTSETQDKGIKRYVFESVSAGEYELSLVASEIENEVSGYFWRVFLGDNPNFAFGDKVILDGSDAQVPNDVNYMGAIDLGSETYLFDSAWLLSDLIDPAYGVFLRSGDEWIELIGKNDHKSGLTGFYEVYVSYPGGDDAAVALRFRTADVNSKIIRVATIGSTQVLGDITLNNESPTVEVKALDFVDGFDVVKIAVSDGSLVWESGELNQNSNLVAQNINSGQFSVVGVAHAQEGHNALVHVQVKKPSGVPLFTQPGYLFAATDLMGVEVLNGVIDARYKVDVTDFQFPDSADNLAYALFDFSGNRVGGSSLTTGSSVSGEFQLDAGNYTLALILGNQSQKSLLAGYKIDQQDSTSNNSGRNNSGSGSSGGGGGGSLGLLGVAVFALLAVFRRKFYAV